MKIGFTGTQRGTTQPQRALLICEIQLWAPKLFVHGGCIGADAEAHKIVRQFSKATTIKIRPSDIPAKTAKLDADIRCAPKPPLERNHHIVREVDRMIACPGEYGEVLRSGTWATIRYARKHSVPILIIYPDGRLG